MTNFQNFSKIHVITKIHWPSAHFLRISLKHCNNFSASERSPMHIWHLLFKADVKVRKCQLITVSFSYITHSITTQHHQYQQVLF